jgi:hypothetical protein
MRSQISSHANPSPPPHDFSGAPTSSSAYTTALLTPAPRQAPTQTRVRINGIPE